jgi:TRAP-type C4-dicarboxylate transport system substrate-binding protein
MGMGKFGVVLVVAGAALWAVPAVGQVQERTIRWGHLNNTDHPVSLGVQKFAEVLAAKSGGKLKICEFVASQLGNESSSPLFARTQETATSTTSSRVS